MTTFRRCENTVTIDGELFIVQDIKSVVSEYVADSLIHFYDGRRHFKSDGRNQWAVESLNLTMQKIMSNIVGIRMAKAQREIDERHLEHLRNKGR